MRLYLAALDGQPAITDDMGELVRGRYVLCTHAYFSKNLTPYDRRAIAANAADLMMDSGAYTVNRKKEAFSEGMPFWERWCDEYADEVLEHDVTHFFEMDLDAILPYADILRLRERMEARTGRQCIPVWHVQRGLDGWKELCSAGYPVIAIGGRAGYRTSDGTTDIDRDILPGLVRMAHRAGCKVHLLGTADARNMREVRADSSDTASWNISASQFGKIARMRADGRIEHVPYNGSGGEARDIALLHNFKEYCRLQERLDEGF